MAHYSLPWTLDTDKNIAGLVKSLEAQEVAGAAVDEEDLKKLAQAIKPYSHHSRRHIYERSETYQRVQGLITRCRALLKEQKKHDRAASRADPTDTLRQRLSTLPPSQLIDIVCSMVRTHPELHTLVCHTLADSTPDYSAHKRDLNGLIKRVHKSLPYARYGSNRDGYAYKRAAEHVQAFKKTCMDKLQPFLSAKSPNEILHFVAVAAEETHSLPDWDLDSQNAAKSSLLKRLVSEAEKAAAKAKKAGMTMEQRRDAASRLQPFKGFEAAARTLLDLPPPPPPQPTAPHTTHTPHTHTAHTPHTTHIDTSTVKSVASEMTHALDLMFAMAPPTTNVIAGGANTGAEVNVCGVKRPFRATDANEAKCARVACAGAEDSTHSKGS